MKREDHARHTTMDKLCKGCILYEEHLEKSDSYITCIGYLQKDKTCPCITCLVKVMCKSCCDKLRNTSWWYDFRAMERERV